MNNVFIQSFETGQNNDTRLNQIYEKENDCLENPFQQISNLRNKNPHNPRMAFSKSTVHHPTVPPSHRPKIYFKDQICLISEHWTSAVRMQLKFGRIDFIG